MISYDFLAEVLTRARKAVERADPAGSDSLRLVEWDTMFIPGIAADLHAANPRFNRTRFIAACGVTQEK